MKRRQDSVSKIQQRFPAKVLPYALQGPGGIPISFYGVWDRIVEFLRYEGKVTSREIGDLSCPERLRNTSFLDLFRLNAHGFWMFLDAFGLRYCAEADSNVQWKQLNMPLPGIDQGKREFRRPQLFRGTRLVGSLVT